MAILRLALVSATMIAGAYAAPSSAAVIHVTFGGTFTQGTFEGTTYTGSFAYDTSVTPSFEEDPNHDGVIDTQYFYEDGGFITSQLQVTGVFGTITTDSTFSSVRNGSPPYQFLFSGFNNQLQSSLYLNYFGPRLDGPARPLTNLNILGSDGVFPIFGVGNAISPVTSQGALRSISATIGSVPEPATWGMMLLGFGAAGYAMRRRAKVRTNVSFA